MFQRWRVFVCCLLRCSIWVDLIISYFGKVQLLLVAIIDSIDSSFVPSARYLDNTISYGGSLILVFESDKPK